MNRKWDKNYLYIFIIALLAIIIILDPTNLFASKTDWINQHSSFPDYFRKLFYETGNLIPNFGLNLGAGQNIFYFSYYGLLNPIILISYFLPFIKMSDYLISINMILYINTGLLLYYWLKTHFKDNGSCFISTIFILLSSSLLFHFHRHFMFVNYMPFLIMGLVGIDNYFKSNKKTLLIISTFLMIMTSYYYSIIGIFLFVLYGIYRYIKISNKLNAIKFIKDGLKFLWPIIISILMASILLLPTAYVILTGRSGDTPTFLMNELLIPTTNAGALLYDTYTLGLTGIIVLAILYLLSLKKVETKFITIVFLLVVAFPIMIYILNGGLYIRNKVFIAFLPLMAYFIAYLIKDLRKNKVNFKPLTVLTGIVLLLLLISRNFNIMIYIDIIATLIILYSYKRWKHEWLLIIPILFIALPNFIVANNQESFVSKKEFDAIFSQEKNKLISTTLSKENSIVRFNNLDDTLYGINKIYQTDYYQTSLYSSTYNNDYNKFFRDTVENPLPNRNKLILTQTNNIMFQTIMGVKYLIYSEQPGIGYNKISGNKVNVYQNDNVLPLGYATDKLISVDNFNKLSSVSRNEALIGRAIVQKSDLPVDNFENDSISIKPDYKVVGKKGVSITSINSGYKIKAYKGAKVTISLDKIIDDDVLFIKFNVKNQQSCDIGDQKITINNVANKQTCAEWQYQNSNNDFQYILSQNDSWNELVINFEKGSYEINDIELYTLNYNKILSQVNSVDELITNKNNSISNVISGKINVKNDGYFVTSIPYDKGFTVKVDNKLMKYEKVNTAFVGFPIKKGLHEIIIEYKAPYLKEGMCVSIIGLAILLIIISFEHKRNC